MKKVLFMLLVLTNSIQAFAQAESAPCESIVLTHAIEQLLDSDNCYEHRGCKTFGGSVSQMNDQQYKVSVEFRYNSDRKRTPRAREESIVMVEKVKRGCVVKN